MMRRIAHGGKQALKILFPIGAIGSTFVSASRSFRYTVQQFSVIKSMAQRLTQADAPAASKDDNFMETLEQCQQQAISKDQLIAAFRQKKRLSLTVFWLCLCYGFTVSVSGFYHAHYTQTLLGCAAMLSIPTICYIQALDKEFRLWQLRTERLSASEEGGFKDFTRLLKGWWWRPLNPEFQWTGKSE